MEREYLIHIKAPHFVAGVEVVGEKIVRCAPIVKYMKGWSAIKAYEYIKQKNWQASIEGVKNGE